MCVETCVKISDKSVKNEEVIAYTNLVVRNDRVQSDGARQGRVGGVVMVQSISFSFLNSPML